MKSPAGKTIRGAFDAFFAIGCTVIATHAALVFGWKWSGAALVVLFLTKAVFFAIFAHRHFGFSFRPTALPWVISGFGLILASLLLIIGALIREVSLVWTPAAILFLSLGLIYLSLARGIHNQNVVA